MLATGIFRINLQCANELSAWRSPVCTRRTQTLPKKCAGANRNSTPLNAIARERIDARPQYAHMFKCTQRALHTAYIHRISTEIHQSVSTQIVRWHVSENELLPPISAPLVRAFQAYKHIYVHTYICGMSSVVLILQPYYMCNVCNLSTARNRANLIGFY